MGGAELQIFFGNVHYEFRHTPPISGINVIKNYIKAKKINAKFKSNFDLRVNLNLKTEYFNIDL
jgi:hypothetical protein